MRKGDEVSTEQGVGTLWEYDADDDEWMVMIRGGLLSFPTREVRLVRKAEPAPVAGHSWTEDVQTQRYIHLYEVNQALKFIDRLKDRGDEPGEMMYGLLAPLAKEVEYLRAEVARLEEDR